MFTKKDLGGYFQRLYFLAPAVKVLNETGKGGKTLIVTISKVSAASVSTQSEVQFFVCLEMI